jgi:RNA polymerase sigma factor (sigma-70 family)
LKASLSPTRSSSALVPSKFAEHWHAASRISHADELQLACRLAECRRERLTLALNTSTCLGRLRRIQTEMASGKVRIQDVMELEQAPAEQGQRAYAEWLERAEQLQRKAAEAWQSEALSEAQLRASEALVRELTLRPATLARALGEGPGAEAYARRALASLPPQLQQLSRRLESEVERIHDRFLTANQGLVAYVVQRYLGMGLSQEDLMQEGNIGLMRAVDKFDHRRGGRFGTYAVWWVRQGVRRALANQSRTIRIPVHALGARYSLEQAARRMSLQLGRDPTEEELSSATGVVPGNVTQLLSLTREPLSLDAPRGTDTDVRLVDALADSGTPNGMQQALGKQRAAQLRGLLVSLNDRERDMLRMRFGLDGADECTLEQIGVTFCVTRERVRQIVTGALEKLHRQTRMQRLELAGTAD